VTLSSGTLTHESILKIAALAQRLRDNPAEGFRPSPALAAFMRDRSNRILVRAANRVGKSVHAACKLAKIMLSYPRKNYRAVGVSYKQSIKVVSKLLFQFIPRDQLADGCSYTETNGWSHSLIRLKNGTTCQIKSSDQKAIAHSGDDLDGIWIDEPPTRDVWLECVKRVMSLRGFVWLTMTPIGRPCEWLRELAEELGSTWVQHVVEFSHANCPWYTREQVEGWLSEASSSPWAYRQTIFGDWEGEVLDRVFTGFDVDCVITDDQLPAEGDKFKVGLGIDHGEGVGRQVALLVLWTGTCMYALDECVNASKTVPAQDAQAILEMLGRWGWKISDVQRLVGDINSAGKLGAGLKVNDVLAAELSTQSGLCTRTCVIEPPNKGKGSVELGEKLLNHAFMQGKLKVHANCKTLLHSLKNYSEGDEDLKHSIDALRYVTQPTLESWTDVFPSIGRMKFR